MPRGGATRGGAPIVAVGASGETRRRRLPGSGGTGRHAASAPRGAEGEEEPGIGDGFTDDPCVEPRADITAGEVPGIGDGFTDDPCVELRTDITEGEAEAGMGDGIGTDAWPCCREEEASNLVPQSPQNLVV